MSIETLKSLVSAGGGYARSNRFSISIGPSASSNATLDEVATFFCEAASIPGKEMSTFSYAFNSNRNEVKYPNGFTLPDVTCTFAQTNDYAIRTFFDKWFKLIVSDEYTVRYASDYERSVIISQLDQQDKPVYTVELLNAYPVSMNSIELSNFNTDDVSRFDVTLTYIDYHIVPIKKPSV